MANLTSPILEPISPNVMGEGMPPLPDMESAGPNPIAPTGMTPEEMKADLDKDVANLNDKATGIKVQKQINQENITKTKRQVLGALFDMLKKNGVDPNNLESISAFIKKLEDQDPDLAALFEEVFNSIGSMDSKSMYSPTPQVTSDMITDRAPGEESPGLMNKFKNLGADMMMPSGAATPPSEFTQPPSSPGMPPLL